MTPVTIDLPPLTSGDTFDGLQIGPVTFNGAPPPSQLASCRLYFRLATTKELGYGYRSGDPVTGFGVINITDPVLWLVQIPAGVLPLSKGSYYWDFETTDAAGVIRTLYKGVQQIGEDFSHD